MTKRIKPYFKGLGDHLQFSTLPEVLSGLGFQVHQHSSSIFSNNEIEDLLYGCNPFIKGKSFGEWDYGDGSLNWNYSHKFKSFIRNIEFASGLDPKNDYPKTYYQPKKIGNFDGIIDLGSVCLKESLDYEKSSKIILDLISSEYPGSKFLVVENKYFESKNFLGLETYQVSSLRNYVDLISSSKVYISFLSGGHGLASSIRHFGFDIDQYCILPEYLVGFGRGENENLSFYDFHIEKGFWTFPRVKYLKY